jgi:hypothetical protein
MFSEISHSFAPEQEEFTSAWLDLLHLTVCELPCWVDIVPGSTDLAEAQAQVETVYGDSSLYEVKQWENHYVITSMFNGLQLRIVLSLDGGDVTSDSLVRTIQLEPIGSLTGVIERPTLIDFAPVLGNPEMIRIASGVDVPATALIYKDQQVYISVDNLECDQVLPNQAIRTIVLSAEPLIHVAWLSELREWRGFSYCYNFERVLS